MFTVMSRYALKQAALHLMERDSFKAQILKVKCENCDNVDMLLLTW